MNQVINPVVIIGGGPAGLSAALYNSRAGLKPLVFAGSPPGGQLTLTSEVENFPGHDHIMGPELIEKMRSQVKRFGTIIRDENVASVDLSKKPFSIQPAGKGKEAVLAQTVIIATGAKALWLNLPSEQHLRGKGVSACATCDAFFFRNKVVAVVGGGDTAMEDSLTLTKFASKVYVIHRRNEFRASKIMQERIMNHEKIEVLFNTAVTEVLGETSVTGLKLSNLETGETSQIESQGLFVAIGHKPDTELFKDQIQLDDKGYIVTHQMAGLHALSGSFDATSWKEHALEFPTMTSIPGVFASGDCVDFIYRQASTAAGMGVSASLDAERWIEKM